MASSSSLSFALHQSYLEPVEQLALIVIADSCSECFTIDEAFKSVVGHTSIDSMAIRSVIETLIKTGAIVSCQNTEGVYKIPDSYILLPLEAPPDNQPIFRDMSGFVYLLQSPSGAYKIGKTLNPKSRFQTFKTSLPFEVEFVCVIKTLHMSDLETELHQRFAPQRVNGEWFKLAPADIEYIKGLAQ